MKIGIEKRHSLSDDERDIIKQYLNLERKDSSHRISHTLALTGPYCHTSESKKPAAAAT
jgi:hypothetical protein